mmetsp:Transcript_119602/g.349783  ORF Transcript_119602/g.349783 Transcript_119602/m.349783 type:complete len:222 (-) Transcript_119602:990-1655(-)
MIDHRVVVAPAHAAGAAPVIHGGPHVSVASAVLDRRRWLGEVGRAADPPCQFHCLPCPRQILRVCHGMVRDQRAHVGGAAGESHRALSLCLPQGSEDGVRVRLERPLLALEGVLQGRGLGRIVERHEGEDDVRPRCLGICAGTHRGAGPRGGLQHSAAVGGRVHRGPRWRDGLAHHLRERWHWCVPGERCEASGSEVASHGRQVLDHPEAHSLKVLLGADA